MNTEEIDALITLLDDPDEEIFSHIRRRLLGYDHDVVPFLEKAWESKFTGNALFQNRIEDLIHEIQFGRVSTSLKTWAEEGGRVLLDGLLLICRYQYPDLDEQKTIKQIKQIQQDTWLELTPSMTALERIRVMNRIFFDVHGFSGNTTNYHAPQNSYLNNVLESKRGNPLSLCSLYMIIARNIGIPLYGINLPRHFILAYSEPDGGLEVNTGDTGQRSSVLFFINVFNRGTILSQEDINHFLKQLNLPYDPSYYSPCNNLSMMKRWLNNLSYAYEKSGYLDKVKEVESLQKSVSDKL